ncbi:N-acetylmuramoyl-L-alanine amidase [Hansschlegelia beijingensis]|uniref:peptidoglycan recognition protein family protein n=1 Tax=Hansschlegelia beijingensis TaxID=1133344 RepID=UPI00387F2681
MDTREIQTRLKTLGYFLGTSGPAKDGVDGDFGGKSQAATIAALDELLSLKPSTSAPKPAQPTTTAAVPTAWMPAAKMDRIIVHWTAGNHKASALDKEHYNLLIEANGGVVRGKPSIDLNDRGGAKAGYAAHTLNCNTGSIGVSLCCMAGAVESPFKAGSAPMTREQWDELPHVLAALCRRYGIPGRRRPCCLTPRFRGRSASSRRASGTSPGWPSIPRSSARRLAATSSARGPQRCSADLPRPAGCRASSSGDIS